MSDHTSEPGAVLPEPVRDHLGQQLRGVLPVETDKPRFLGDDSVPDLFEPQIRRLETRLKTHEEGTGAVGQVLDQILDAFGVKPGETDGREG
ncbi:hypothetical protein MKK69_08080 [Methylobacterium sp. J-026]|uniref:hypothetical protein n=1 Tax=Methylobacterium sp. J-026 TaxID=2836624 RepID=UPI001FBA2403|nr:hypothetical protein [Methylobacterium sp. J-026]MCJ2134023.1 hypothetical protein [Methylobacterium sp. J-026]